MTERTKPGESADALLDRLADALDREVLGLEVLDRPTDAWLRGERTTLDRERGQTAVDHGRAQTAVDHGRAQTAVDYAVGIATFLLVVAFVFAFVPSIMGPFTGEPTDRPLIADRSADHLSKELLVEDNGSIALDESCTKSFFAANGGDGDCRYDADGSDLPTALAVERPGVSMNVTVSDSDGTVRTLDGTELAAGGTPHRGSSVASARRVVLLNDERGYLQVRVW